MKKQVYRIIAFVQMALVLFTGCHPTQPFFIGERGDLAHYLDTAMKIEYPDVQVGLIPEATLSMEPLSIDNQDYEIIDLSLEDCISFALANTKLVRSVPGSSLITADIATAILSSPSQQLRTAYDPAITASTASPQPLAVDSNGNRTLPRGAARSNQVGGVEAALAEFDAQYSSFVGLNTTDRPRNTGQNIFTPVVFTGRDGTYQSALSKRLATGGVVTARAQTTYSQNNVQANSIARFVPSDFTQTLEMQIQHPLMRNRGTMINRIPVVLARINEDISLLQYEESVRNAVKEVEVAYWDLYCAYWALETARTARDIAQHVWKVANERVKSSVTQPFAKSQAEAQLHQFQAQLAAAWGGANLPGFDNGLTGKERRLRSLMGWPATDGRLIRPSDKPVVARVDYDWDSIRGETLLRNVDLRQQRWVVKQRELELISAKNQILPEVNVSALYRWLGVGDVWLRSQGSGPDFPLPGSEGSSAWESLMGGNYQEAGLRLELIPNAIGARNAHAYIRSAQLNLAREHAIMEEKEIASIAKLTDEVAVLATHFELMQLKLNQWAQEENGAQYWLDQFETGANALDLILDNLLRAQERRARAQQEYYRAVCEYNKSIVMVHLLKGSLLEYDNVILHEGPWPEKAQWDAHERARERDAARIMPNGASRPAVISQGEYMQHQGTANETGSPSTTAPTPKKQGQPTPRTETAPEKAEEVPAVPNNQNGDREKSQGPEKLQTLLDSNIRISRSENNNNNNNNTAEWTARSTNHSSSARSRISDDNQDVQSARYTTPSRPPSNRLRN